MSWLSSLVISRDDETIRVVSRALEDHRLETTIIAEPEQANELVRTHRFDLAITDYDVEGAGQLAFARKGSRWRGMLIALVRENQLASLAEQKIHLRLLKPLTHGLVCRGLRAIHGSMVKERRTNFRHKLQMEAKAELITGSDRHALNAAKILNLSLGGLCLQTAEPLSQHATVRVALELPQPIGVIDLQGTIVWAKPPGICGLRFHQLSQASQKSLAQWLENRFPRNFPQQH